MQVNKTRGMQPTAGQPHTLPRTQFWQSKSRE